MRYSMFAALAALLALASCDKPHSEKAAAPEQNTWRYSTSKDEMRGSTSFFAMLDSTDAPQLGAPYEGGSPITVVMSRDDKSPRYQSEPTFMLANGQFDCRGWTPEGCRIAVKADKGEVFYLTATEMDCGTEKCLTPKGSADETPLIGVLRTAKEITVELPLFQFGSFQYHFHTAGFKWPEPEK